MQTLRFAILIYKEGPIEELQMETKWNEQNLPTTTTTTTTKAIFKEIKLYKIEPTTS